MPGVANLSIQAKPAEGEAFNIELEVGTPYHAETGEWACPVALGGLYDRLPDVRGADSFQALCMAIALVQGLLQGFIDEGGSLSVQDDRFPLEAYSFGARLRA